MTCPVCKKSLLQEGERVHCVAGHTYEILHQQNGFIDIKRVVFEARNIREMGKVYRLKS